MSQNKKQLLITCGPQGSGNHIFARIFSMHPDVNGWDELTENYWVGHQREKFAMYWWYPQLMKPEVFDDGQYFITNVSYPYIFDGYVIKPKILEVANIAKSWGIDVQIAVIARDEKISRLQQERLRKKHTIDSAKDYIINTLLASDFPVNFISLETFFCYKTNYLKYLEKTLNFPIDHTSPEILKFIDEQSPNEKYIIPVDTYPGESLKGVEGQEIDLLFSPISEGNKDD
jgi:hypothetical protein